VHSLVYAEPHEDMSSAIQREKQLKKWSRAWKIALIEKQNPTWRDLSSEIS
jgi:putative endonuclease